MLFRSYDNPYDDITDKVGIRFVVLDHGDIKAIEKIVESLDQIDYSKDRDFEEERLRDPTVFVYQSVHYIVRPRVDLWINSIVIKKGTPCEIQIRTILQHAYSEITHDTIYKPSTPTTPKIKRLVARSMALIETTDEIFNTVKHEISDFGRSLDTLTTKILNEFTDRGLRFDYEPKTAHLIFSALHAEIDDIDYDSLLSFYDSKPFLIDRIKERSGLFLFQQPVVILVYFLAKKNSRYLLEKWPIEESYLHPIFTDLGISIEH